LADASKTLRPRRRAPADTAAASLNDVARAAGVSTASASRALARPELVSEALRTRVLHAAARLGYVGNAAARFLATGRSGLIGAVLGEAPDPVEVQMLQAAESVLSALGVGLLIRVACPSAPAAACAQSLTARGVDGLLYIDVSPPAQMPSSSRTVPSVACGRTPRSGPGEADGETLEQRGLMLVCGYLQQLGHSRIGAIGLRRPAGDEAPLSARDGIAITVHHVDCLHESDAVRAAARALIGAGTTAVVAASDLAAAAVVRECRAQSRAVPDRISVIGWGDTDLARNIEPQLTSVRVPSRASGQAAAEYLVAAIAGRDFRWPELPLKLVIRESTGPASD